MKVVCKLKRPIIPTTFIPTSSGYKGGGYKGRYPYIAMMRPIKLYYFIGHNYHVHYFHAEDLNVNNYVRENNVCGIKVRE